MLGPLNFCDYIFTLFNLELFILVLGRAHLLLNSLGNSLLFFSGVLSRLLGLVYHVDHVVNLLFLLIYERVVLLLEKLVCDNEIVFGSSLDTFELLSFESDEHLQVGLVNLEDLALSVPEAKLHLAIASFANDINQRILVVRCHIPVVVLVGHVNHYFVAFDRWLADCDCFHLVNINGPLYLPAILLLVGIVDSFLCNHNIACLFKPMLINLLDHRAELNTLWLRVNNDLCSSK